MPCALLGGFGGGAIDAGLNAYAATDFSPRHMNWMHACFGLGVAIGPLIMTAVISRRTPWRLGYALVAAAQLCLALSFVLNARSWGGAPGARARDAANAGRDTLRLPVVWLGVVAFGVYVAVEAGAGPVGVPAAHRGPRVERRGRRAVRVRLLGLPVPRPGRAGRRRRATRHPPGSSPAA